MPVVHNQPVSEPDDEREGVRLTSLDDELFDGAGVTKRDLVDYLEAVRELMLPGLQHRPLSVLRIRPGQAAFMQKNLPKYAPAWIERSTIWAEASKRHVAYAICNDWRTLVWFANQRAVEYHVTLFTIDGEPRPGYLVLDLDPPEGSGFDVVVATAQLARQALAEAGLVGAVKTSGAKGVHVFVPLAHGSFEDAAAATRRWRFGPSDSIPRSPPPCSSRRTDRARCSSTRRAPAVRRWWRRTALGSDPGSRCPSRSAGTSSTRSGRPTSRCTRSPTCSATTPPGPSAFLHHNSCRTT